MNAVMTHGRPRPPPARGPGLGRARGAVDITAWFGDHKVLDRVSLTMPAGGITALIGPSGCGKSTFLRILNRMHELVPSAALAGEVLLDGEDIYDPAQAADRRPPRRSAWCSRSPTRSRRCRSGRTSWPGCGSPAPRPSRSAKDELVESCLVKGGLWKEVKDRLDAPGGGLSGGQQQRLCIARSLAIKPRVLLMDEPCSALDPTSTRVIEETMAELAREVTIVIVTHNMQQAARVSDQCAFFLASQGTPGVIVEHGDTPAMFQNPQDQRTATTSTAASADVWFSSADERPERAGNPYGEPANPYGQPPQPAQPPAYGQVPPQYAQPPQQYGQPPSAVTAQPWLLRGAGCRRTPMPSNRLGHRDRGGRADDDLRGLTAALFVFATC